MEAPRHEAGFRVIFGPQKDALQMGYGAGNIDHPASPKVPSKMKLENVFSSESYTVHNTLWKLLCKVLHATSLIRCVQPKLPADNGAEPERLTIHIASKVQATGRPRVEQLFMK